jgi:UDP-N-acetylmuramoylalanine-D-glutamate ligase
MELKEEYGFGIVWIVWGLTHGGEIELVAITSSEEKRDRYMVPHASSRFKRLADEKVCLDHAYGRGMLGRLRAKPEH